MIVNLPSVELSVSPKSAELYAYIGLIVARIHVVSQVFNLGGALRDEGSIGEEFDRRRGAWYRTLKKGFNGSPADLSALEELNGRLVRTQTVRDALVHGAPRLARRRDLELVVCTMAASRRRYRQMHIDHLKRTASPEVKSLIIAMARRMIDKGVWDLEVSFTLEAVRDVAKGMDDLVSDVMFLTGALHRRRFEALID